MMTETLHPQIPETQTNAPPDRDAGTGAAPEGTAVAGSTAATVTGTAPLLGATPIGIIETLEGKVTVIRANGARTVLEPGATVYEGDVIETGEDSALGIVLADETTFSMAENGEIVLTDMAYDPATQEGSLSISVLKGVYTFVSGQIAKTDAEAMTLTTPVATIGVQGTQLGLHIPDGQNLTVVMMREADGFVGQALIRNDAGLLTLNQAHQVGLIGSFSQLPVMAPVMMDYDVIHMFGATLTALPMVFGQENDYGSREMDAAALSDFETRAGEEQAPVDHITVVAGDYTQHEAVEGPKAAAIQTAEATAQRTGATDEARTDEVPATAEPVPPTLSVTAAGGGEDTAIALTIEILPGTGEITSITVSGVPDGAVLSAGTDNGDGTWTLLPADLGGLTVTPPADSSADFPLGVSVASSDGGTVSADLEVSVAAVADQPSLGVTDVNVDGGGGLPGDDRLIGTGGADTLVGGGGDDLLKGRGGADVLYGDSTFVAEATTVPLDVRAMLSDTDASESLSITIDDVPDGATLSAGTDTGGGVWTLNAGELDGLTMTLPEGVTDDFQLHVNATATDVDVDGAPIDAAVASEVIDVTFSGMGGDAGDDRLYGGSGDDALYGGGGEDLLKGQSGSDVLYGGDGDDLLRGGGGDDVLYGGADADVLRGDSGADTLYGEAGEDLLRGGGGADTLMGGAGDDILKGDGGADQLYGGAGEDSLIGGGGADTLVGGAGDDYLKGGGGRDSFIFNATSESDFVADFRKGDELRFEGDAFSSDDISVQTDGNDTIVTFGNEDVDVSVTLNSLDLAGQGYTVTQEPDAVVVVFDGDGNS